MHILATTNGDRATTSRSGLAQPPTSVVSQPRTVTAEFSSSESSSSDSSSESSSSDSSDSESG